MTSYFDITTLENVKGSWVTLEPLYFGIARKLSEYLPGLSFFYWWLLLYYLLLHPVFSAVVANLVKNCAPMQWCSSTPAAIKILLRHPNSCWKVIMVNISSLELLSFTTMTMCIVYSFTHVYSYPFSTCYLTDFSSHRKNVLNVGFSPSPFSVYLPFFPQFSLPLLPFLVKICLHV